MPCSTRWNGISRNRYREPHASRRPAFPPSGPASRSPRPALRRERRSVGPGRTIVRRRRRPRLRNDLRPRHPRQRRFLQESEEARARVPRLPAREVGPLPPRLRLPVQRVPLQQVEPVIRLARDLSKGRQDGQAHLHTVRLSGPYKPWPARRMRGWPDAGAGANRPPQLSGS
jgi:hypothetical protein